MGGTAKEERGRAEQVTTAGKDQMTVAAEVEEMTAKEEETTAKEEETTGALRRGATGAEAYEARKGDEAEGPDDRTEETGNDKVATGEAREWTVGQRSTGGARGGIAGATGKPRGASKGSEDEIKATEGEEKGKAGPREESGREQATEEEKPTGANTEVTKDVG